MRPFRREVEGCPCDADVVRRKCERERARVAVDPRTGGTDHGLGLDAKPLDPNAPGDGRPHSHDVPLVDERHLGRVARHEHGHGPVGIGLIAGDGRPDQQPVCVRSKRGEVLRAGEPESVAFGGQLGVVDPGRGGRGSGLAADRGEELLPLNDRDEVALPLRRVRVSRDVPERVRVDLDELSRRRVRVGKRLQDLVVRQKRAFGPEPSTTRGFVGRERHEIEAAEIVEVLARKRRRVVVGPSTLAKARDELIDLGDDGHLRPRFTLGHDWFLLLALGIDGVRVLHQRLQRAGGAVPRRVGRRLERAVCVPPNEADAGERLVGRRERLGHERVPLRPRAPRASRAGAGRRRTSLHPGSTHAAG